MRDANFVARDYSANFKQIIAKRSDLARFDGGRMKKSSAGATNTYEAGTVLGLASSGADSGYYKPYSDVATDGSQVAVGVLSEKCSTDEFGFESEIVILKSAVLLKDLLIGLDAAAIVDLRGSSSVEHGTNLFSFNV